MIEEGRSTLSSLGFLEVLEEKSRREEKGEL